MFLKFSYLQDEIFVMTSSNEEMKAEKFILFLVVIFEKEVTW